MKINDIIVEAIKDGTKGTYNNIPFVYNAKTNAWVSKIDQTNADGLMAQELFKAAGYKADGKTPIKANILQRTKDFFSGKTGGLAQATRSDPKASIGKKLAGIAGAALGGTVAGGQKGNLPTELPAEIKAQIDNLTKSEKQYLITKLTAMGAEQ